MKLLLVFLSIIQVTTALLTADEYVVVPDLLPGLSSIKDKSQIPIMHAGLVPLNLNLSSEDPSKNSNYFFWKFKEQNTNSDNLIIWLNGGPGCSSMDGALIENGPFRVNSTGSLYLNEGSWHTRGDIVYVDQPVGTGFSFSTEKKIPFDNDLEVVTKHFMEFLKNYYKIFPDDLNKDLILAGESYAGQYIPFFANAIQNYNLSEDTNKSIKLKALLIGNGWIDPINQSLSYVPFALENKLISGDSPDLPLILKSHEKCQNKINSQKNREQFSYPECDSIINSLLLHTRNTTQGTPANQVCLNVYDINLRDSYPACGANWPIDINFASLFFGNKNVLQALNLDPEMTTKWTECNNSVLNHLTNPNAKPSIHFLSSLLESGIDIILYNGANDFICNSRGVLDSIEKLQWGGYTGFTNSSQYYEWVFRDLDTNSDEPAGFVHYDRNLTFISVYNASHMVPYDRNEVSRGIVDIYLNNVLSEYDEGDGEVLVTTSNKRLLSQEKSHGDEGSNTQEKNQDSDYYAEDDYDYYYDYYNYYNKDNNDNQNNGNVADKGVENSEEEYTHPKAKFAVACIFILSVLGVLIALFLQNRNQQRHPILRDPNSRSSNTKKTVSWDLSDDDIAFALDNEDEELDLELQSTPEGESKASSNKNKKGYTPLANTDVDDSFELQNL